jgi:hypothetical protein
MSASCSVTGWDATLSAPLSSQLAAVLAGFVFTSIVFLIGSDGRRYAHALGLFCAAFVALGFDSHLYSVLSGAVGNCSRIWAQTVIAAGLLGVGAMAIITGLIWLLSVHSLDGGQSNKEVSESDAENASAYGANLNLSGVLRAMAYGVSFTITCLLGSTVYSYLYVAKFPAHLPSSWAIWIILPAILILALTGLLKLLRRSHRIFWPMRRPVSEVALWFATYGILAYSLANAIFAGIIIDFSDRWWENPPEAAVVAIITSGLVFPIILFVVFIQAKPSSRKETGKSGASEDTTEVLGRTASPNGRGAFPQDAIQAPSSNGYRPRHASTH